MNLICILHNLIMHISRGTEHLFPNNILIIMQIHIITNPFGPLKLFTSLKIIALQYSLGLDLGLLGSQSGDVEEELACRTI